jgi:predicted metal-binding membrane protein
MAPPSMLEGVLHRDRLVVVAVLLLVIVLSWLWVAIGSGMSMSAIEMTLMPRDMVVTPSTWTAGYAALMLSMWFVMMVAMMLPSATPMLLIFARVSRRERAAERPWVSTGVFASGYLAAWACFSVVAVAMQWGLEESGLLSAMMVTTKAWLGAMLLAPDGAAVFGGVMNLLWISGLAACVLLEKTLPIGHWLAYAVGGALVVWGLSLVLSA